MGLAEGYASVAAKGEELSFTQLIILNADGDLGDVETAMSVQNVRHSSSLLKQSNWRIFITTAVLVRLTLVRSRLSIRAARRRIQEFRTAAPA